MEALHAPFDEENIYRNFLILSALLFANAQNRIPSYLCLRSVVHLDNRCCVHFVLCPGFWCCLEGYFLENTASHIDVI